MITDQLPPPSAETSRCMGGLSSQNSTELREQSLQELREEG